MRRLRLGAVSEYGTAKTENSTMSDVPGIERVNGTVATAIGSGFCQGSRKIVCASMVVKVSRGDVLAIEAVRITCCLVWDYPASRSQS